MDGFQERLRTSLQLRLSVALAIAIVVTAVAAGAFSFVASFNGAHELQDDSLRPFATSINGLLDRVSATLTAQRRFVADAAHELRSPLTALTLQAERLGNATMSEAARERLLALQGGIDRRRALIEQMLALARSQSTADVTQQRTSARPVIAQVVVDLLPLADARRIDFGVSGEDEAWVSVSALDFATLIRNLADNALRYTPEGGRVDIALRRDEHALRIDICDDGPGIAPEERERVFDPFYRGTNTATTGSGLGLAIVRTIAERYGVTITLDWRDAPTRRGLCARLRVPLASDAQ